MASSPLLAQLAQQYGGTPAIPAVQRSEYLARALDAMSQMGQGNQIKSGTALGSNLLAEALLQFQRHRNDTNLMKTIQGGMQGFQQNALTGTGLPGDPMSNQAAGGAPPSLSPPVASGDAGAGGAGTGAPPPAPSPTQPVAAGLSGGAPSPMPATGGPTNGNMELAQALAGPSQGAAPPPAPQGGFVSPSPPAARNNPGNLRPLPNGQMWQGQTGVAGGFDTFGTPEAGDRAATINLQNQERLHGLNTISQIVAKWAPKGDGANDPAAYAATVGRMTGIDPNQPIDLNDPATLQKVKGALYTVEQGHPVQGSAFAQSSPPSGPQSTSSGEQSPPTPRSLQIATGGSVSIPSPEANGPVGASPFAVQPQAPVGPANAPPRPAGPPTGPQATPQEIAIYQAGMRAPPGSPAYMQAMQLAHQIQQRASQPIAAPDREHWDAQQGRYVPLPGAGYQQIAAGPNGGVQADPFGKRDAYSNPNVGALGPNQVSNADGSVSNRPVEQQQTFKIPGANGVFVNGPDGRPMKVADDAFSVKDLGDRLTKLQGSDQYKAADNAVNMYTAATQAAQRPGGISDVELRDFAARQFSGGVARQFNVEALNNAQGAWANLKQFAPELISGQHMSPAARSALLQAMHDDAVQAQTSFQHLSASDEAFAQAQGTSLAPYLSPLARQLPPMPSLGQIPNGSQLPPSPGQPQAQQPGPQLPAGWPHGLDPNKQDGQAALALIQQHGYRFQNGQLVK